MQNQTIFQFFHWYYPNNGSLWDNIKDSAAHLSHLGVTECWIPPCYKSYLGVNEPGYAVYDLFDLGEFDQKGTTRTKYGTKQQLLDCIGALHYHQIGVLADVVFNHRIGADEEEEIEVVFVDEHNRNQITGEPQKIKAFTRFTFEGRQQQYSNFIWDYTCFKGLDVDGSIALIKNEYYTGKWLDVLDKEHGNYDFLMGNDVNFDNPYVREELKHWGRWFVETTQVGGFRLDAIKHMVTDVFPDWLQHMEQHFKKTFFCVGEFWSQDVGLLLTYIEQTENRIQLFDVPLHYNFYNASIQGADFDLTTIFDNSLLRHHPERTITFVDNHDTQPLQSLESTVEYWFKPIAYAFILLRSDGIPCVFYPALYEAKYTDEESGEDVYIELNKVPFLEPLMQVRKALSYGEQHDYFDHANVVGWTRSGAIEKEKSGCAVLVSNSEEGFKEMYIGTNHAGRTMKDCTGNRSEMITINEDGKATFLVNAGSVSVWIFE